MGSPYEFDEYPYDGYADERDTQFRGGIVSLRYGKVCDKENADARSRSWARSKMGIWSICGSYTRAVEAKSVKRPGSRTHQDKRDKTGDVEEIAFVSGRSELSPAAGDTHQLDGAEAVGQMHGEDSDRQQDDGGNAYECDEGSDEDRDAAANFGGNGKPGHELRRGDADGVEDGGERGRSLVPFRETMGQKSVADDQSKWDGGVRREFRFHLTTHSFQMIHKDGTLCGDGSYRGF